MKNTMFYTVSEIFCPHYCISCAKAGGIVCECCKKYIMLKRKAECLCCSGPLDEDVCKRCALPFYHQYCLGKRDGLLKELISIYKYNSVKACGLILAQMVAEIGHFANIIIVPLPTIDKHIRERGFDHTGFLARRVARFSGARCIDLLKRANDCVQVGADEATRRMQAESAYAINKGINKSSRIILLDDV